MVGGANRSVATETPKAGLLHELDNAFATIYQKVAPSVVVIDGERSQSDGSETDSSEFFSQDPAGIRQFRLPRTPDHSEASGFIVRQDGYILTNNHAVAGCEGLTVKLKDGRVLKGKIVGTDEKTDVAVIKVDAASLPCVEFGDSDALRVGQLVGAIGAPFNLDYTFTVGWVSAKGRTHLTRDTTFEDYIQTNAFINPGDSGSPLFDLDGKVVGMNTLINGLGRGLSFAVPSNLCQRVETEIIATGRIVYPWLGITLVDIDKDAASRDEVLPLDKGVGVQTIEAGTPAYRSDLRPADVITQVDGVAVANGRDLQQQILRKKIGQTVELVILRAGKPLKVTLITAEMPAGTTKPAKVVPIKDPAISTGASFGLQFQDATKELAAEMKFNALSGAVVTNVQAESAAAAAGIQRKDVITEADGTPVPNAIVCKELFDAHDAGKAMLVLIDRGGQKTFAVLKAVRK